MAWNQKQKGNEKALKYYTFVPILVRTGSTEGGKELFVKQVDFKNPWAITLQHEVGQKYSNAWMGLNERHRINCVSTD